MIDEELIFSRLAERMDRVTWTRDPAKPDAGRFVTKTRRIKLFYEVAAELQPWCGQAEQGTTEQQTSGMPYKSILEATWIIYQCVAKDPNAKAVIENNLIIGGVRKALAPLPSDPGFMDKRNTLDGLVYHCFIGGRIFKDPGDIDGQGMITIPIKLLVP